MIHLHKENSFTRCILELSDRRFRQAVNLQENNVELSLDKLARLGLLLNERESNPFFG